MKQAFEVLGHIVHHYPTRGEIVDRRAFIDIVREHRDAGRAEYEAALEAYNATLPAWREKVAAELIAYIPELERGVRSWNPAQFEPPNRPWPYTVERWDALLLVLENMVPDSITPEMRTALSNIFGYPLSYD